MTKQEVLDFLTHEFALSNLPESFQKLREISNDPHSDIQDVVAVVRKDVELAARLLKLANSSLFSRGEHTETIEQAAQKLGMRRVVESSLAIGLIKEISIDPEVFDTINFWKRSLTIAKITEDVFELIPHFLKARIEKNLLYTAGLLHDVGILAMIQGFSDEMVSVVDYAVAEDLPIYVAERNRWGFSHQDIGRILFKKWNLPESLQAAAGYHHNPVDLKRRIYAPLVDIIYVADYTYSVREEMPFRDPCKPVMYPEVWKRIGIDPTELVELEDSLVEAKSHAEMLLAS
ncbi:HDOD domain-containing protein [Pelagicoccus sp. SDUM812003]|uniref:HDOD domain-containing protein n=1 Tax=Pelagicoccus sp. SDUM812003 TaxID=3041267 RepID=UPI00280FF40B|nr:HDOD domain-containing protein [Pelagicoccus sp. SDUM812003]MDQ8203171.1 HDOD domain-containing protein [Pelagicoccus sp. SDUM812003]